MCENFRGFTKMARGDPKEAIFFGCGIVLESHLSPPTTTTTANYYLCTILAPANLFKGIPRDRIDIDVYVPTGVLHKAKLLVSDFHYNLAVLTINSESQLPTAVLTSIDDVLSIDPTDQPTLPNKPSFCLRAHSPLFKVSPDTQVFSVSRSSFEPLNLLHGSGTLCLRVPIPKKVYKSSDFLLKKRKERSSSDPKEFSCNELYEIKGTDFLGFNGAPVLNSSEQIIGIVFDTSLFLPSNVVSWWWEHYKSSGSICRPFHGIEVVNLHEADLSFLSQYTSRFPTVSTAVVVTKVERDSPACRSGICTNDVIVKLEGKLVRSKMQFYETIWENVGKAVEVNALRVTDGEEVNGSLMIEECSSNQFHEWPYPSWDRIW